MSAAHSKKKERIARADDRHTEGDITIISSDCVSFKIHIYYLQAHSKDLEKLATGESPSSSSGSMRAEKTIKLSDTTIEDSLTVRPLLDYMTARCLPDTDLITPPKLRLLMRLARKYDCHLLLATLPMLLQSYITNIKAKNKGEPTVLFAIAADFGLTALCGVIIAEFSKKAFRAKEAPSLDFASLPLSIYRSIPWEHHWAFTTACATKKQPKERSQEFPQLMHPLDAEKKAKEEKKRKRVQE